MNEYEKAAAIGMWRMGASLRDIATILKVNWLDIVHLTVKYEKQIWH